MSSEIYSYLYELLLKNGALDVYTENIYMKKNRPAIKLNVICEEDKLDDLCETIFLQTTTFGVRYSKYDRKILKRKFRKIETEFGEVNIKLGYYDDKLVKVTPEYEDCKNISEKYNISILNVYNKINYIINKNFDITLIN